ncbi:MAG: hypothetical protein HFE63_07525 [Clostridiales bacterium]|nr:hypothetical protein [Clostridiales bacterium]
MDFYDDDVVVEEKDTYKDSGKIRIGKYIKLLFKIVGILIIVAVYAIIFLRLNLKSVPKSFREFVWTDEAMAAYQNDPDFEIITQEPADKYDANGYYEISDIMLCSAANEVQLTLRYNSRSTINTLMDKYGLTERPVGEVFVYQLRDQDGNIYSSYRFAATSKPMSEFRRLVFDGIDFDGLTTLYIDIYYGNDVSSKAPLNATIIAYDSEMYSPKYKFTTPKVGNLSLTQNPQYINKLNEEN